MNSKFLLSILIGLFTLSGYAFVLALEEDEKVSLTGVIENVKEGDLEIIFDQTWLGEADEIAKVPVVDGAFSYAWSTDKNEWIMLRYNGMVSRLYVEPGNEIKLGFDGSDIDGTLKLSGKGAANNKYWRAFSKATYNNPNPSELKDKMLASSIDAWEIFLFDKRLEFDSFFKENQTEYAISYDFEKYLKTASEYYYLRNLMAFPIEKANKSANQLVQRIPEIMLDVLKADNIQNEDAMIDENYREFITYLVRYKAVESNNFEKFEDRNAWLRLQQRVSEILLEGQPLQYALAERLWSHGQDANRSTARSIFRMMKLVNPESRYPEVVEAKIGEWMNQEDEKDPSKSKEEILAEIEQDREAMKANDGKFRMEDLDGKKVAIEDFVGKVVYLDVWASWCGPCIAQVPHAKKLKEKLTDEEKEQIVFLYISIDNHESRWKGAIEKHDIKGVHLRSPGGWDSEITKMMGIRSIPRFMLINKNGEIVQDTAPRPSDPGLYDALLALVAEDGPDIKPEKSKLKDEGEESGKKKKKKKKKKKSKS